MSALIAAGMARLILVRHGEASGNRELRYLGTTDAPLTERGRRQAEQVARALSVYAPAVVYTSPLVRAAETAAAIGADAGVAVRIDAELRETAYGEWEGLTRAQVMAKAATLLRRWEADAAMEPPGGGESLCETQRRVAACADKLAAHHAGTSLALVSHVGPVKALVSQALGLGAEAARRMWLDPASISVVDWPAEPGGRATLRLYNSIAHLADGVRWLPSQ